MPAPLKQEFRSRKHIPGKIAAQQRDAHDRPRVFQAAAGDRLASPPGRNEAITLFLPADAAVAPAVRTSVR